MLQAGAQSSFLSLRLSVFTYPAPGFLTRNELSSCISMPTTAWCIQRMISLQGVRRFSADLWVTLRNNASILKAIRRNSINTRVPWGSFVIQGRSSS